MPSRLPMRASERRKIRGGEGLQLSAIINEGGETNFKDAAMSFCSLEVVRSEVEDFGNDAIILTLSLCRCSKSSLEGSQKSVKRRAPITPIS